MGMRSDRSPVGSFFRPSFPQGANPINYLGNYQFGVDFDPALRFTFTLENGKASKVTLLQGGARVEGPRVP